MSTVPRKTPVTGRSGRDSPANGATSPTPGTPRRSGPGSAAPPTPPGNGLARARSVRNANGTPVSARSTVKKPAGGSNLSSNTSATEQDARMENSSLVDQLKQRLQDTENASEELRKQVEVLQARFDEAVKEQGKLEDKLHEEEERVEGLDNSNRESIRQRRELETIYEAERAAAMKEREATQAREEELQSIIQRLKESLSQKESKSGSSEDGRLSRGASSPSLETGFAPPSALQRSNSRNNSKLILQKDQVIESLRLELAELQFKLIESENLGDASRRVQELERTMLEQRMTNARLMEDIDSYQLLLSERTLNGDFSRNDLLRSSPAPGDRTSMRGDDGPTSLADELTSAASDEEGETTVDIAHIKRVESEVQTLKDSNKALTLYINKIIDRILQHQGGYENILSNHDEEDVPAEAVRAPPPNKDKDLPPPPPPPAKDQKENKDAIGGPSLLQRASSVVYGGANRPKPRPMTTHIPTKEPGVTEDPATAPSIPLQRSSSKRMSMDISAKRRSMTTDWNAAAVVGNMYRGPSGDNTPSSPGIVSPRNSFFGFRNPSGTAPTVSSVKEEGGLDGAFEENDDPETQRKSALDALNGSNDYSPKKSATRSPSKSRDTDSVPSVDTPSPPRSTASREDRGQGVMTGRQMRPLRLVKEAEEEQKKANRTSWAIPQNITSGISGWFGNKDGANKEGGGSASTS